MSSSCFPINQTAMLLLAGLLAAVPSVSQQKHAGNSATEPSGIAIHASASSAHAETLLDPQAADWEKLPVQRVALNRTPRLYDTEAASDPEIPFVEIRLARSDGKVVLQMVWRDSTKDTAEIPKLPGVPTEGRSQREQTAATDRFFDAAAVMYPARVPENGAWPTLQMGDVGEPVVIYYWNAARGTARMQAEGRGTTRRTGETFPAQALYRDGSWHLTMELPDVPAGMPLAFAVWNGSQQDRDGRKYFTTWLKLE